jgi:hypothetical protein
MRIAGFWKKYHHKGKYLIAFAIIQACTEKMNFV